MKKIDEKEWKTFPAFSDNGLFHIATTSSSIDAVRLKDGENKSVPYVTRTDVSNGIARFVSAENYDFGSDDGECITVGLDTQTAFYQPHRFVTGQNVHVVTGRQLSEEVSIFLVTILREQMQAKFNWGGNGATLGRMKRLLVMLPVDDDGKPDYDYMAQYASEMRKGMLMRYKNYVARQLSQLEYKDIPALNEKDWEHFLIPNIFSKIQRGKRLKNADHISGETPYVSSTANNNGVDDYIEASHGTRVFKDCISLANSGSVGTAFYEPFSFVASDHVTSLKTENGSKFVYLFLVSAIEKQGSNFNFNREINDRRIKKIQVMLPVDNDGKPDYAYMEQYAKNMMLRKYKQYLTFADRAENTKQ